MTIFIILTPLWCDLLLYENVNVLHLYNVISSSILYGYTSTQINTDEDISVRIDKNVLGLGQVWARQGNLWWSNCKNIYKERFNYQKGLQLTSKNSVKNTEGVACKNYEANAVINFLFFFGPLARDKIIISYSNIFKHLNYTYSNNLCFHSWSGTGI